MQETVDVEDNSFAGELSPSVFHTSSVSSAPSRASRQKPTPHTAHEELYNGRTVTGETRDVLVN